jgi:hypothetical protein
MKFPQLRVTKSEDIVDYRSMWGWCSLEFVCLFSWRYNPFWYYFPQPGSGLWPPFRGFLITQRRARVGRTPLDEWAIRRRDLYLTTHNTHNRQTSMPPLGYEPTISAGERPKTYALDCTATATGCSLEFEATKWFRGHVKSQRPAGCAPLIYGVGLYKLMWCFLFVFTKQHVLYHPITFTA